MNGDSKLLTLAALGVIGLGTAMPYWSASTSESQAPPEAQAANHAVTLQPPAQPAFDPQRYWDQQVSRPDAVTLTPRRGGPNGLDNPAHLPSLSMDGYQRPLPTDAQPILADVPINQVGSVTLASRVEAMDTRTSTVSAVVPIEIPGGAANRSVEPYAGSPTLPVIERRVMRPELPGVPVEQQFTPLPRIAPPNHGAASGGGEAPVREHRVRDGDSLESIAEKYLGNPLYAEAIYRANRSLLDSPDLLPIGSKLVIPAVAIGTGEVAEDQRPMTRLRPISSAGEGSGGDQPWTELSPPRQ